MFDGSELVEQLPYLRRMARALTRNRANADDLVQSCLERAWVNQEQFAVGTNLRGWLLTIMHNLFIDSVRRNKRERENCDAAQTYVTGRFTPCNQEHKLELQDLQEALAGLPVEQYTTLVLVVLENLSYEQAAKVTKVPVGTIRSRLSRARAFVAMRLHGEAAGEPAAPRPKLRRRPRMTATAALPRDPHVESDIR
jgi:RNA polymerase sigma-70 factor (ECF subfamily)